MKEQTKFGAVLASYVSGVAGLLPVEQVDLSKVVGQGAPPTRTLWDNGEWWMLLAAQSMALGTIMVRWVSKYGSPPPHSRHTWCSKRQ